MIDKNDLKIIEGVTEEFFSKMTIPVLRLGASLAAEKIDLDSKELLSEKTAEEDKEKKELDAVDLDIRIEEPQILIGQSGQTLFEIQRILKMVLNKKIKKIFYLNIDINDYKKKKIDYLKTLAKDLADEVAIIREEKVLLPMPPYERRIVHLELKNRTDVTAESEGEGELRHIVIKPK